MVPNILNNSFVWILIVNALRHLLTSLRFLRSGSRNVYHADERWPQSLPRLCSSAPRQPPEAPRLCPWESGSGPLAATRQSSTAATAKTSWPAAAATATSHFQPVRGEPAQGPRSEPPATEEHVDLLWSVDGRIVPHAYPLPQSHKWRHVRRSVLIQMFVLFSLCNPWLLNLFFGSYGCIFSYYIVFTENCPDHSPSLSSWNPGHQPEKAVVVRRGHLFRLDSSASLFSLTIQSGGKHTEVHDSLRSVWSCNINGFTFIKYD